MQPRARPTPSLQDPFAQAFATELQQDVRFNLCRHRLLPSCFDAVVLRLAEEVATLLERELFTDRIVSFNELGAMQLEKELRVVVNGIDALTPTCSGVRVRFSRLDQCSTLLNLEHPGQWSSYALPKGGARLSGPEIREVLKRRVDFDAKLIDSLDIETGG